jgi:ribosomal protein S18 acetylase RimI-like enzyme
MRSVQLKYSPASPEDIPDAIALYVQAFSARLDNRFSSAQGARIYAADLIRLLWISNIETTFVARTENQSLLGYVILEEPRAFRRYLRRELRGHFAKMFGRLLTGRYKFAPVQSRGIWQRLRSRRKADARQIQGAACVSVIAVSSRARGQGIAKQLLELALERTASERVWLAVEPENVPAVTLYQKLGFRLIGTPSEEQIMLLDLATREPQVVCS